MWEGHSREGAVPRHMFAYEGSCPASLESSQGSAFSVEEVSVPLEKLNQLRAPGKDKTRWDLAFRRRRNPNPSLWGGRRELVKEMYFQKKEKKKLHFALPMLGTRRVTVLVLIVQSLMAKVGSRGSSPSNV